MISFSPEPGGAPENAGKLPLADLQRGLRKLSEAQNLIAAADKILNGIARDKLCEASYPLGEAVGEIIKQMERSKK